MSVPEAMARLVEIRLEVEQHESALWRLRAESDELQFGVRRDANHPSKEAT